MTFRKALGSILLGAHLLGADRYADLCKEAASLSQQGNYDAAIQNYKAALSIRPGAPEALNNLAVMYYSSRRYAEAFKITSALWPQHPELRSAALIAGMAAVQCNQPQRAIAPLEKLLAEDPTNRDAVLALASARIALGDLNAAAAIYKRQTTESPKDSDAWYGLAHCYEEMAETGVARSVTNGRRFRIFKTASGRISREFG